MAVNRSWAAYPATYRADEMAILADWILAGESCLVVGLPGCGRSNLLGFLCHRPEVLSSYHPPEANPVVLIPLDLNDLPAYDTSTLYRIILRAFYRIRENLDQTLQQATADLYQGVRAEQDPFLSQSALYELLLLSQAQQVKVVLILNRFDRFCAIATPQMINTLRGLRDSFKNTLCYIAGMRQEVAYLPDPTMLGEMYELLDSHVCWVGAMSEADARNLITRATRTARTPPNEMEITTMLTLTGCFPALLKAACHWWLTTSEKPEVDKWVDALLAENSIQYRLKKMWDGLTQEEQLALSELQILETRITAPETKANKKSGDKTRNLEKGVHNLTRQHRYALTRLAAKGLCTESETGWRIVGELLARYVANVEGRGKGKIWLDDKADILYQGRTSLKELTPLERSVLCFFVKHPRVGHPKTDLIMSAWPEDVRRDIGVSDDSLYQVISSLREKIEPNRAKPCYITTWRGQLENGYQFFPEGRPE